MMKLAEALLLRADLQKKIASLRDRIVANGVVQEGDKPHENPAELMKQAVGALGDLESLVTKINRANLKTKTARGKSLTEAIAHRDMLAAQHALYIAAIGGSKKEPERYSAREIKWVATLEVAKLQKQADDLAKKLRELNADIQKANWAADLGD
jgi:predicted mannosyl-3-phosphoglycerate phosphatase (HAD superfamily)